jgi:hypothetical protein
MLPVQHTLMWAIWPFIIIFKYKVQRTSHILSYRHNEGCSIRHNNRNTCYSVVICIIQSGWRLVYTRFKSRPQGPSGKCLDSTSFRLLPHPSKFLQVRQFCYSTLKYSVHYFMQYHYSCAMVIRSCLLAVHHLEKTLVTANLVTAQFSRDVVAARKEFSASCLCCVCACIEVVFERW